MWRVACSGPLPSEGAGAAAGNGSFFPALRNFNMSHNRFSGTLPIAFGFFSVFNAGRGQALLNTSSNSSALAFDVSSNSLTGALPSFLQLSRVPEDAQKAIFVSVSRLLFPMHIQYASPYANGIVLLLF